MNGFDIDPRFAALIAGAALGANLLGTGLLIIINPGNRSVRWYALFNAVLMTWLALQGWFMVAPPTAALFRVYGAAVHLLPAFFFAATLVEASDARARWPLLAIGVGVATLFALGEPLGSPYTIVWQAVAWGGGGALHFIYRRRTAQRAAEGGSGVAWLRFVLLALVPAGVIGAFVLRGAFIFYGLPIMTIFIQFLIFVGVVHHRFYDIEVRAARTGEIASRAAEQERLALLGELSASLAHEVRNPLTGMRSLAQRLAGGEIEPAKRQRYAGVILDEIARLDRIVSNLLDLARRSRLTDATARPVPLAPLFDDLTLLVESRARAAGVSIDAAAGVHEAFAPREPLAQVLLNLLLNAVRHSPAGGVVTLRATRDDEAIRVTVRDHGPGVPTAEREAIFAPFRTTGLGTGLGLAVVRRLGRELGWEHGVGDAPGGGAEFWIRLPAAPPEARPARERAAAGRPKSATP